MGIHLQREIQELKKKILSVSALVEENVYLAVKAIVDRDADLAREVIGRDCQVDSKEVEVEEECLKILALHQPVAADLRFIVAVLKINNDLERIGDLAVNISERGIFLATQKKVEIVFDFPGMAEKTQFMLRKSLDALVNMDANLARQVLPEDDRVDDYNRQMYEKIKEAMRRGKEDPNSLIHLLFVSRHLERIADHADNIAKDVIYMVEGEIVRHRPVSYDNGGGEKIPPGVNPPCPPVNS